MIVKPQKSIPRTYSRHAREAVMVLGQLIRINRIERKISVQELATRVGISRDMMHRIEQGDPRCGIGFVFEAAVIVGVPLLGDGPLWGDVGGTLNRNLTTNRQALDEKLRLLPKAIHKSRAPVTDDF